MTRFFLWIFSNLKDHFLTFNSLQYIINPTSFSPVTSTNVNFGPQNFLTFSFHPFATPVQNFKFIASARPKLVNLDQDHPSKNRFFWANPYKIEVMITFFIEMLKLRNFGNMTASIIYFESCGKILLVMSWTKAMTS